MFLTSDEATAAMSRSGWQTASMELASAGVAYQIPAVDVVVDDTHKLAALVPMLGSDISNTRLDPRYLRYVSAQEGT